MIFLLLIFLNLAYSAVLTGKILDNKTGQPLIGANVYLEDTTYGSNTDIDGQYIILNVPNGEYTLTIKYIGYENFSKTININKDKRIIENFMISPSAIEMERTEIIGTTEKQDKITNAPATKEVISSERIAIESSANFKTLNAFRW